MSSTLTYTFNKCNIFAILLVILFSACTEEERVVPLNNKQLQVSVNANGPCLSRTVIHDEWLPDGSTIGVSLFNANNNGIYEDKDYNNIMFTASGSKSEQKWSGNKTVLLSDNQAELVAYYPWSEKVNDLSEIPVEVKSQTDYMYSTLMSGYSNAKPEAEITMYHALTAIRVRLVLGEYSTAQKVSEVAVSSAGLATSGLLNAFDGSLSNIKGQYTSVSIEKDFSITTTGTDTDFLFVPDASETEGKTDVSIFVDGTEYCTSIDFTEAYKQGYIYTYILKWDHTGLQLDKVKVTPWNDGKDASDELQVYIPDDEYIVEITVPNDNYDFRHNIEGIKGSIDWGDGIIEDFGSGSYCLHNYEKAGTYTVIVKGKLSALSPSWSSLRASKVISKLVKIGVDLGIKEAAEAFSGQTLLSEIVPGALDGCFQVTDFGGMFAGCTSLQAIPEGLFDKCTKAVNFGYNFYTMAGIFQSCSSLTEIPEGLFDKCTKVTNFKRVFAGCTKIKKIPNGLFDYNIKVTDFSFAFQQCWNLESIPVGLFDNCPEVTTFEYTFGGASGVSGGDPLNGGSAITEIPEGLFDNNTKVTSFRGTFSGCSRVQCIPERLFDSCKGVNTFNSTFRECTSLISVPADLFKYNKIAYDFSYTFNDCVSLEFIPARLLADKNQSSSECDFYGCFNGCKSLKEVPEGLFENTLTEDYGFSYTFGGCSSLEKIGDRAFKDCSTTLSMVDPFTGCINLKEIGNNVFENCTKLERMDQLYSTTTKSLERIGNEVFKNCPNLRNFGEIFQGHKNLIQIGVNIFEGCKAIANFRNCTSLTEIPAKLLAGCDKITSLSSLFYGCKSLAEIPIGLFDYCPNVTDFSSAFYGTSISSIPEGLFDKCTEVTNFGSTFHSTFIASIPEGLFDKCTKVTSLYQTFQYCNSLTEIPTKLFDKCTKVTDFIRTFYGCENLIGESPYTTISIDGVETKVHLYDRANYPEYFTVPAYNSDCFYDCSGLTDYSSIPSSWK